ncbi:MAG: hypothetical protein KAG19_05045 [Methylococcales bacterium]|nr:hypothetical protein [Methylococcales bacterium]
MDGVNQQDNKPTKPDNSLGPLKHLPGLWKSLPGRGWNMIALPFSGGPFGYRLLLNQYDEELAFKLVDKGVPNRGISTTDADDDQLIAAIDYEQSITQLVAEDSPVSGKAGAAGLKIHHEPGFWLHMINNTTNSLNIARLATIPHGDSVLALGSGSESNGAPFIPDINGLPIGVPQDINSKYLQPYQQFNDNLFRGLFNPVHPNALLKVANEGVDIVKTTKLEVDTTLENGGIVNIPFVVKQANAADMKATFWIQELAEKDAVGNPKLRLQYSQVIFLDFFDRRDGMPGLIRWPHISINTLEKMP